MVAQLKDDYMHPASLMLRTVANKYTVWIENSCGNINSISGPNFDKGRITGGPKNVGPGDAAFCENSDHLQN